MAWSASRCSAAARCQLAGWRHRQQAGARMSQHHVTTRYVYLITARHRQWICIARYMLFRCLSDCLSKFKGQKTPIFADLRTQNQHYELRNSLMRRKSGNLKQQGQSLAMSGRPYQTWWESAPFHPEIGGPLGVWSGAGKLWIHI